jgi:O-glycosyl hydrolase
MRNPVLIRWAVGLVLTLGLSGPATKAAEVKIDASPAGRMQAIDGFGTCLTGTFPQETWFQDLYFDDLGCSIVRMDLTPKFKSPVSDFNYYSPWFMGSGTKSPFNIEDKANPAGPEGNRVRTYTSPEDYSREFGGKKPPIAVMTPDIAKNIAMLDIDGVSVAGAMAQAGKARSEKLGGFKLCGSIWSPAPWVKMSSGNKIGNANWPLPPAGAAWPFVWGGNFAGGRLDVSGKPLDTFNDGTGPTSSLTQFARCTAAWVKGFQDKYGVEFYAISIQNELNFEVFYNSCTYPLASQYITALKAVRAEFDKYPDLKDILIAGPEDLLGGDVWGMWQFGGGNNVTQKNLQYLKAIAEDPEAAKALAFFNIHGYAPDGASSAGASPTLWDWWANGWTKSPAGGIPDNVKGFAAFNKPSWMTETSGEQAPWLSPASGFPKNGGWSIALKIQQALTVGRQSAWIYWQFAEKDNETTGACLTRKTNGANEPKYVAAKHFFKFIRPGAVALKCGVGDSKTLTASAYLHEKDQSLAIVLVNSDSNAQSARIALPDELGKATSFASYTSADKSLWKEGQAVLANGAVSCDVPGYGVVTLHAKLP